MFDFLPELSATETRWLISGIVVLALLVARFTVLRLVLARIDDPQVQYRGRKLITYLLFVTGALVLARVWVRGGDFGTTLGLVSAGVAIALADVLKNMVGWLFIVLRRPFRVGDRVEVRGQIGDVVDLRLFRFSMLEVGNWVDADQSTGRIVHVPNGVVFTEALANYTEGFGFIWHELPMLVTFESDWELAERIMQEALDQHAPHHDPQRATTELRRTAAAYSIRYTHLTPATYLTVRDSGVLVTGRLLVEVRKRRGVEQAVWRSVLRRLAEEPTVELAYPTVRTFLHDPVRVERAE